MKTKEIKIHVDEQAARIYQSSSEKKKRVLDVLLSTWLSNAGRPSRPLKEIRREASEQAQKNGLTPEILSDILDEE